MSKWTKENTAALVLCLLALAAWIAVQVFFRGMGS